MLVLVHTGCPQPRTPYCLILLVNIEMSSECKRTPQVEGGKGERETLEGVQLDGESVCIVC